MRLKRGDMVFVFDPVRPTGSGSGHRGLCIVGSADETEVIAHPLAETHNHIRVPLSAVHIVFSAAYVAEDLLR